jgi:type II secretory pathway predicted ATPase ExeA
MRNDFMKNFRFSSTPFTRELRIEQRFQSIVLEEQLEALRQVVEGRGSAALVAPAGTGKTVILRALRASLAEARYRVVYIKLADLSARDMCRQLAIGLSLAPAGHYPALLSAIEERFRQGFDDQGLRQIVIFDDAHDMRPEVIRLVRMLTNFEMDSKLVVSMLLVGQLPLKKQIMASDMEDVKQRLAYCGELRLLSREEAGQYIEHRMMIAGAAKNPFAPDAIDAIFEITHGNIRAIDKMANAALLGADKLNHTTVSASDVVAARSGQWM